MAVKNNGRGAPIGNQNATKHGFSRLKALLNGGGLDQRTSLYRALLAKEKELATSLGGDPSPQEQMIISDTIKTLLFLGSLDAYLIGLKSLVRKGRVHCVLSERTRLAGHLRENLKTLGLERRAKPIPDLHHRRKKFGAGEVVADITESYFGGPLVLCHKGDYRSLAPREVFIMAPEECFVAYDRRGYPGVLACSSPSHYRGLAKTVACAVLSTRAGTKNLLHCPRQRQSVDSPQKRFLCFGDC